jgi:hypothetical protein
MRLRIVDCGLRIGGGCGGFVLRRRALGEEEEEGEKEERMPEWQVALFCRIPNTRADVKMGRFDSLRSLRTGGGIFTFCGDVAFCRILSHLRGGALGGVRWRGGRSEIGHAGPPLASLNRLYLTLSELSS